jgi:sulfatase-modifying factor enzyme 1
VNRVQGAVAAQLCGIPVALGKLPKIPRMEGLVSVRRSATVAFLLAGIAAAADAAVEDDRRRLDDRLFFVASLDKGWEPLLADCDRSLAAAAKEGGAAAQTLQPIADRAREDFAGKKLKEGEKGEPRALELFEQLAASAADEAKRPQFHDKAAKILMDQAERAESRDKDDAKAIELANRALKHLPDHQGAQFGRAVDLIGRLGMKVGLAAKAEERYDAALESFQNTATALRSAGATDATPKLVEVKKEIEWITANTGVLRVAWLGDPQVLEKVKGDKTTFFGAATLKLTPSGAGREPPAMKADGSQRRIRTGRYAVTASVAGKTDTFATSVEVTSSGGEVALLTALPSDMVYVPAAGGHDAFLIDRTEVSNARLAQMGGSPKGGNAKAAVAGISYEDARRVAESAGKRLPTLEQWTHAAFGAPLASTPRYPWGNSPGEPGVHFVANVEEAQDVESCPTGRSPLGCLNMAGNVWEWIEYRDGGWLIGGGWKQSKFDLQRDPPAGSTMKPWVADLLRDPLPTKDQYESFKDKNDEAKYFRYQATETTLPQAGFRCVVPLGQPRR